MQYLCLALSECDDGGAKSKDIAGAEPLYLEEKRTLAHGTAKYHVTHLVCLWYFLGFSYALG